MTATLVNDGDYAMPGARFTLGVPAGWTVASPAPVTVGPGQTVTRSLPRDGAGERPARHRTLTAR